MPGQASFSKIVKDRTIEFSRMEYLERIEYMTMALSSKTNSEKKFIGLIGHSSFDWHIFDMAVISAGSISVPIYQELSPSETSYILNHADIEILFVDSTESLIKIESLLDDLPKLKIIVTTLEHSRCYFKNIEIFLLDDFIQQGIQLSRRYPKNFKELIKKQNPEDIVSIIYTSGTSGTPRGAVFNHASFVGLLDNLKSQFKTLLDSTDSSLIHLPLAHVLGKCNSLLPLVSDIRLIFFAEAPCLLEGLSISHPSVLITVPANMEALRYLIEARLEQKIILKKKAYSWLNQKSNHFFDKIEKSLSPSMSELLLKKVSSHFITRPLAQLLGQNLKVIFCGGSKLNIETHQLFRNLDLMILEGYGLTETLGPCVLNPIHKQFPGTAGIPFGDFDLKLGDKGEVFVKGASLFKAYHKEQELYSSLMQDGWLDTGDLGSIDANGYLRIEARKQDIICLSNGINISPNKISNALELSEYISRAVIAGDDQNELIALISLNKEGLLKHFSSLALPKTTSLEELAHHAEIIEIIRHSIFEANRELGLFEKIKYFNIFRVELSTQSGHLTPTQKTRRVIILEEFSALLENPYSAIL